MAFEDYFKKAKGERTVIYHKDHVNTLTDKEKKIAISEVGEGGYISVKMKV